ncbi:NAD-dependent dihydropyrimidine dehydrogenase subunit PreT [hydrothermal vent metagenome]|uniref:Dihydrothymine dehydrogenase n=1 Tax=hydrothermal vent metagenome TaxID=652676 RepID=A0A3B0SCJ3_9ZZZZ
MAEHPALRKDNQALSSDDIAANFDDLHPALNLEQVSVEATRCLFCYDAPCVTACPTEIDIPKFIRQIATGNVIGSARTILTANIMGGTCARACPTEILCEQKCVLVKGEDAPVNISALQRHAVDHLISQNIAHPFMPAASTGKTIAIIGAGPAGLACAHELAKQGHKVQIFETKAKPGGLNEYGLAAYKMADDFAAREVAFILQIGGINIQYGRTLGENLNLGKLQDEFDAVFLAIGLEISNQLGIAGEQLDGVQDALQFIANLRQSPDKSAVTIGQQVVVIGGGNTAIDAAVQAARLGANKVSLVYRRGAAQMGATEWEQDLAKINGVTVQLWAKPVGIDGTKNVQSISFERTQLQDGKLVGTGESFCIATDMVLSAVGQKLNQNILAELRCEGGKIVVDANGQTSLPGVFAGGDCIGSGEDLTVQAVQDGKLAAAGIHQFLGGNDG